MTADEENFVIGIDPGMTTGLAVYGRMGALETDYIRLNTPAIAKWVWQQHQRYSKLGRVLIVIEDFIGSGPRTRGAIYTLKLIGALTFFCDWHKLQGQAQEPQRRKAYLKQAKKALGVRGLKFNNHQMDAMAHAMSFYAGI